jgi:hypothetical protein
MGTILDVNGPKFRRQTRLPSQLFEHLYFAMLASNFATTL